VKTRISIVQGQAQDLSIIPSESVELIVTSPPYPMIEMWDGLFVAQDGRIQRHLEAGQGRQAFERMHRILDAAWAECDRVLKPGGIACINIGDATRTLKGDFQLYSNHSRVLRAFLERGYAALPDIVWRKPTNAPNKFMGSGMLPVGAYVTYEHEYVLVLRKGLRRKFASAAEKRLRRESAFFWEERNVWFSDVWHDIKGTPQALLDPAVRQRSAAFPFELAYRLICMFSIKQDVVLDPFAGTGTTLVAALAGGRNAVGVEMDESLTALARRLLAAAPDFANAHARQRLARHLRFALERTARTGPLKYINVHYGFPVVTSQERELLLGDVLGIRAEGDQALIVEYGDGPQADLVGVWPDFKAA
jgi:DNA modification methylase